MPDELHPVIEECRAKHGNPDGCLVIYGEDMRTPVRMEWCRQWCPLLKKVIDG